MSYLLNGRINSIEVAADDISARLQNTITVKAGISSPSLCGTIGFGSSQIVGITTNDVEGLSTLLNTKAYTFHLYF